MQITAEKKAAIPVFDGLWETINDETYLVGSYCTFCKEVFFPRKKNGFCSHCQHETLEDKRLSREGKITTFTVVHQQPAGGFYKGPVPFAYGIVQLPEGVNVQTLLTGCDFDKIRVGVQARLLIEQLYEQENGSEVITYKFSPLI